MSRVSSHFGLSGALPFIDVHVDRDSKLFVDPSAIRNNVATNPLAARAHAQLTSFFSEVLVGARSTAASQQVRSRELLRHLHEPNETRLGMSEGDPKGRAFGEVLGTELWDELVSNPACQTAALTRLEDTRLLLRGVGYDRISDMTTRIVFDVLCDFTEAMMVKFPALAAGSTPVNADVWDATALTWVRKAYVLPFAHRGPLVLVPQPWVYWRTLMDVEPFYNNYATDAVQKERTRIVDNKRIRPSKAEIKDEHPDHRKLNNDKSVEYKTQRSRDLIAEYRTDVDNDYKPISDDEVLRRTK